MKKKRILATLLTGIIVSLAILSLTGCNRFNSLKVLDYNEVYTPEENKRRIEERTEKIFASEIASGKIVEYTVEILYEFYSNTPRYFMVEVEYAEEFEAEYWGTCPQTESSSVDYKMISYQTKWKYCIGYIQGKEYYVGLLLYQNFVKGRNPYDVFGYGGYKKYYGAGQHAVEVNGQKLRIYAGGYHTNAPPPELVRDSSFTEQFFITKEQEKAFMENNQKQFPESRYDLY